MKRTLSITCQFKNDIKFTCVLLLRGCRGLYVCGRRLDCPACGLGGLNLQEPGRQEWLIWPLGKGGRAAGLREPHRSSGSGWLCEHSLALRGSLDPWGEGCMVKDGA